MAKKQRHGESDEPAELPEASPMPHEASPGGTEGADSAWAGGQSNVGEVISPAPEGDTTYSGGNIPGIPRVESVSAHVCDRCGQAFQTEELLNVHRRTAHRPTV
jgi:hypothetical protein